MQFPFVIFEYMFVTHTAVAIERVRVLRNNRVDFHVSAEVVCSRTEVSIFQVMMSLLKVATFLF